MHKILYISLAAMLVTSSAFSQETERASFAVTANPSYYFLGGYSVKANYILPKKWSFAVAAEANFELPDFARDQFFDNDEDITVDWDYLIGIEARYRFTDSHIDKGLFLLGTFGYEGWTITNDAGLEDEFDNWYASLGIGYNWYPFKKPNFHLGASYNVVFILNNTDDRSLGESTYNIRRVVPPSVIPTVFIGWRF